MKAILNGVLIGALLIGVHGAAQGVEPNQREAAATAASAKYLSAPQGMQATPLKRAVFLKWQEVPGSTGYRIYWARRGHVFRYGAKVYDVPPTRLGYRVRSLTPGVSYNFRVAALSSCKEGRLTEQVTAVPRRALTSLTDPEVAQEASLEVAAGNDGGLDVWTNRRLRPPKKFRAEPGVRQVVLQWKAVAGSEGYRIYWTDEGRVSPCSPRLVDVPPEQLRYEVSNLSPGVRYKFRVCTLHSSLEGPLSRQVGAVPKDEVHRGPSDDAP